ncbi:FtsX-like permease family protein [Kineosporia rhizophila]|uniref:ABC transporter permease n=1 Tax=Kineosporia TaxID=49184 RepID=UPI001E485917|nr:MULTISPECIES: FtsX-like permease family protein [Kineosporia]MCE0537439.1 FtsX-like permease family protein [Kineosporia rhizophila]GLY17411.1 ABC transporter permease [Kineosporia sp. NBRC 101677]
MIRYALRTLWFRRTANLAVVAALALAAALVTACGSLLATGLQGQVRTERYAAADLMVTGDQAVHQDKVKKKDGEVKVKRKSKPLAERVWLPEQVVAQVRAVPGVQRAVPELTFPANPVSAAGDIVAGPDGAEVLGHAWESAALTPFTLESGSEPTGERDVVLDQGLAQRSGVRTGDSVQIQSASGLTTYQVTGLAESATGELREQSSLFFSSTEAARLSGRSGQVATIGVIAEPGVEERQLKSALSSALAGSGAQVRPAAERGAIEFLDADRSRVQLISLGGALAGTSLMVGLLVITGILTLAVQQRSRELALLRAIAATPRQARRLIGAEALLLAVPSTVFGALLGLPLAFVVYRLFVGQGIAPETMPLTVSPFPPLAAALAVTLGALVAARLAARRVARIRPGQALAESATEPDGMPRSRLLAGTGFLAAGLALLFTLTRLHTEPASSPVLYLAIIVLSTAVALLGPVVTRLAVGALGSVLKFSPVSGFLAAAGTKAYARRFSGAVTPLTLLVGMTCAVLFAQTTIGHAARNQLAEGTLADLVVASSGPGVPAPAAEALRATPGVETVTQVVHSTVRVGLDKYPIQGVTPNGLNNTMDPDVVEGSLDGLADGGVAISENARRTIGGVGSRPVVTLGDGTRVELTVVAVYRRGLGFGDLTAAHDLVAAHMDRPAAATLLVRADPTAAANVQKAVQEFAGLSVQDQAEARTGQGDSDTAVTLIALGLILGFTAIAVVNTLALTTSARGPEYALLRLIGATRRQVMDMLRLETLLLVLIAAVVGTLIAVATLTAFAIGMTGSAAVHLPPVSYAAVLALATALALGTTVASARVALRAR